MKQILLPRTNKQGKPRISYSQYKTYTDKKSFNLSVDGWIEYMASYFLNMKFKDKGWGEFGKDVESYIENQKNKNKFTKKELVTLDKIEPLGVFQEEFEIDMGEFVLVGIIDDRKQDWSIIRDYKTASANSKKQYEDKSYKQLKLYSLKALEVTGKLPKIEIVVIERKGNCMWKGGRDVLTVGKEIWNIEQTVTMEELEDLKTDIVKVATEISDLYKMYIKLNKS